MADPATAALDPIFWSFHSFIDLMWWEWQQRPNHHVDTCLACRLCGLTRPGSAGPATVADALTTDQLGYQYEVLEKARIHEALSEGEPFTRPFESHPAVDFVLSASKAAEIVRISELAIPKAKPKSARLRLTGIRLDNRFTYEGNIFLYPKNVAFQPRDRGFRERYLVDLFSIWMMHGHKHDKAAPATEVVVDLDEQIAALVERHPGETWMIAVAVLADTPGTSELFDFASRVLAPGASFAEAMGFQDMLVEVRGQ